MDHTVPDTTELTPLARDWVRRLSDRRPRVAFADGDDERVREAATRLVTLGLHCTLVSHDDATIPGVDVARVATLAETAVGDEVEAVVMAAGKDPATAAKRRHDPVWLAACLTRRGDTDATVAGAGRPTSDVLRAGLQVFGLHPGVRSLTSSFVLDFSDGRTLTFADCGVIPVPTADQLADIACTSARTFRTLTGQEPRVALLSFSTKGSASHDSLHRLREAREIVNNVEPDLLIDDELQFDAALEVSVAARKAPGSPVAGRANVLVFPDLAAANIGYKIAERIGGASAYGPLLQGLAGTVNDLSRGCSVDDIVSVALISALQADQ